MDKSKARSDMSSKLLVNPNVCLVAVYDMPTFTIRLCDRPDFIGRYTKHWPTMQT